jgi:hypothetical protein
MSSLVGGFEDDMAEFHNPLAAAAAGGARPFSTAAASSTTGAPVTETDDEQEWASNPLMSRSAATSFADMSAHTGRQRTASNFKANPLVNLAGAVGGSGVGGAASSSIAEDDEAAFSSNPLAQAGDGDDLGAEFGDDDGAFASNPLGGDGDDLPAAGGEHADLDEDAEFAGNAVEGVPTSSRMDVDLEDDEEHHGGAGTDEDAAAEEAELAKNAVDTTKRVPPPVMTTAAAGSAPASMVAGAGAATGVAVSVPLDRTSFTFDIYVFFALFVCTLLPFLGLPLYQRHLLPELARRQTEQAKEKKMDKLVPDVAADSDDEEGEVSTYRPLRASPEEPRSPRRVVPLATFAPSADMVRAADAMLSDDGLAPSSSSGEASGPYFAWTWESALLAAEKAAFPWLDKARKWWNAESASTEETIQHVVAVLKTDKRYLLHPHFLSVARPLLVGLSVMLMFFFLVEDVHLSLKSALLYALRFYVCGVAAFAALGAVHSEGLIDGYKSVLAIRDRELEKVKMKFVMLPADDGASASAAASSAQGVKEGKLHSSNALQLLRSIDSLSKANKSALLEKRMVWIFFICTVRACVGLHAAWTAGSGFITSVLYGAFHLASGFFFFALASQTEFELHDDQRRWHVFSAIHSAQACRKLKLPFYIPLAHLGTKSNNIQGQTHVHKTRIGRKFFLVCACILQIDHLSFQSLLNPGAQTASVAHLWRCGYSSCRPRLRTAQSHVNLQATCAIRQASCTTGVRSRGELH